MKKRIATMLLSALLVANISSCNYVAEDRTSETETLETNPTESSDTESDTQSPSSESETNNETVRDVPELGQLKLFTSRNLTTASIWTDQKGEYYIYINEWDAYRHLRGLSSYHFLYFAPYGYASDNNIVVESETATIAIIDQDGKHDEPTLITYHFNKSNNLVELHAVPLNIKASSEYDTFLVNMLDEDHGYYFLTSNMDGDHYWRINEFPGGDVDKAREWPLFMFETTNGGESWNLISTNTFSPGSSDYINILKFVSQQVGIISFRDLGTCEVWERSYLTVDGGLTWTQMSKLPPSDTANWYSEIIDFEYLEDRNYYLLTVKASNYTSFQLQLWSKDLINWTLIET